jgi:hypothetical protein
LTSLLDLTDERSVTFLDEVQQELGPTVTIFRPAASRVVEGVRDLVGFGDQMARSCGRHTGSVTPR